MDLNFLIASACLSTFTGKWITLEEAGFLANCFLGRTGRGVNPPSQLGHTLNNIFSTHSAQKVHSKVQIIASGASGGRDLLQFSQVGLSSKDTSLFALLQVPRPIPIDAPLGHRSVR